MFINFEFPYSCRPGRARSVMHKLDKIWSSKQITVATKMRLLKALVWSVTVGSTYGSESWTYMMHLRQKIRAFELACCRKILSVSCRGV